MKFAAALTKKDIALPVHVAFDADKTGWVVIVHILFFAFRLFHIYAPALKPHEEQALSDRRMRALRRMDYRLTKAYADERQKAPRNRRRKPSKPMANLYNLER